MSTDTKHRSTSTEDLRQEMEDLIASCGPAANKHDLAIITIEACIDNGVNTKPHLIGILQNVGLDRGHIAITLEVETASRRWRCVEGVYHVNPA